MYHILVATSQINKNAFHIKHIEKNANESCPFFASPKIEYCYWECSIERWLVTQGFVTADFAINNRVSSDR